MISDESLLDWARFVATKFQSNVDGWRYTRDLGNLEHIRYKTDYTGRNVWWRRVLSAFRFAWNHNIHPSRKSFARRLRVEKKSPLARVKGFGTYFMIKVRKADNLPDGLLNSNPVFWEEDGEYGVFFGPTVGVKVLDFIEAEPDNPHAVAIFEEMRRVALLSFPGEETEDESS